MNIDAIDQALATTMQQISDAARRGDLGLVKSLTSKASELNAIRDQFFSLQNRIAALTNASGPNNSSRQTGALREVVTMVTEGMINQSLLTLTEAVKRRIVTVGERLFIETPNGETFETMLLQAGKKLQERGKIQKFYRDFNVTAGDNVVLRETAHGHWRLEKS